MGIHVLDSRTIDRIAAGEVVERPASVVKELVENAIDAGSTAITVEAKEGGIEFIRVTDNGCGIEREQLPTAFLRHATSKIEDADDLNHIASLGFRGEALSSIAAVSRVEIITKRKENLTGTRMVLEGAKEQSIDEIGAPDGTTFLMRNLFFNTPVRRKFLKQPATEGSYITDLMEHLALSRPELYAKAASMSGALDIAGLYQAAAAGNNDNNPFHWEDCFGDPDKLAGSDYDLFTLYDRDVKNGCVPKLYQAVGRDDFLYPSNVYVRKLLEQKQADLTYEEDKGGHDWNFWDQYIQHILDWMLHD